MGKGTSDVYLFVSGQQREGLYPCLQDLQDFQKSFKRKRLKMICIMTIFCLDKNYRLRRKTLFCFNTENVRFWNLGDNETVLGLHWRTVTRRGDLNICQQDAIWGARLSPLQPQRNMSHWEASVLPCQSRLPFCWLLHRQCSAAALSLKTLLVTKEGLFPSLRNS